jgi:hypothetical protein
MRWFSDQSGVINSFYCDDTVATASLYFFEPTQIATTTPSSTILSSFACGVNGSTSSTGNLPFGINQAFIVEVTSTLGVPVSTFVHITYTKL